MLDDLEIVLFLIIYHKNNMLNKKGCFLHPQCLLVFKCAAACFLRNRCVSSVYQNGRSMTFFGFVVCTLHSLAFNMCITFWLADRASNSGLLFNKGIAAGQTAFFGIFSVNLYGGCCTTPTFVEVTVCYCAAYLCHNNPLSSFFLSLSG